MNDKLPPPGCPECGKPIRPQAPMGLCPACLMAQILTSQNTGNLSASADAATTQARIHYLGDYVIIHEIARGGMGIVYKARQASLNRVVAVKMILAGQLASESDIRRFRIEAEAAANLQHPNIVTIHEVGTHEGMQYFSMDYVEGMDLAESLRRQLPTPKAAAQLVKTLAGAIQYAHQRGILHRDLKPQNVLLDEQGQPRISDFGLAKRIENADHGVTQSGSVMGSPSYMPPEQATGRLHEVGPASDVYSLGAILYHVLTGKAPFTGASVLATLNKVIGANPEPPRKLRSDVPADLETICLKCLEKEPGKRYGTARALEEDLNRFLNQEPILAKPASAWRKTWSWSVRNPWAITGVGTLALLSTLGLAYGLWEQVRHLEWERTRSPAALAQDPGGGMLQVLCVFLGVATAVQATGMAYIRRRKRRTESRLQPVLGWIAGLCWIAFGLGGVRIGIWSYIWEQRAEEGSVGTLFFKSTVGLAFAWAGALYLWRVVRNQHLMLFGADDGEKTVRTLEVLNPKTLSVTFLTNGIVIWLLSRWLISPPDYNAFMSAHPGFSIGLLRMGFVYPALVVWLWVAQVRGFVFVNKAVRPSMGMLVLFSIMSCLMLWMGFKLVGSLVLSQAMLTGLVCGLLQARLAKLTTTLTTSAAPKEDASMDPLFDLIHWNEWLMGGIVAGVLIVFLLIVTNSLSGLVGSQGGFLFTMLINSPCAPLIIAWRKAQPGQRSGLLPVVLTAVLGSLAVTANGVLGTGDLPLSTAIGGMATGYLISATMVMIWRLRPTSQAIVGL